MNSRCSILVFGNYDGTNIGDDCILLHVLGKIAKCANRICVPSRRSTYINKKYNVNSVRLPSFRFISEFFRCDVFLIGGGGIFSGYVGPYAKLLPLFAIFAKLIGKKVLYYNVGVYNTAPFLVKELVKLSMVFSDEISVRDNVSLVAIGYVKRIKNVKLSFDPGLILEPTDESKAKILLHNERIDNRKFLVGLSLKYTMNEKINSKIVIEISRFARWLIENFDAQVVFFPFSFNQLRTVENDLDIARRLQNALKSEDGDRFRIIKAWNYTPDEIKGMVGLMNFFVGMRFHSIVFAYSMKKPLIGISYEEKCRDFLESRKLPFIEAEDVDFVKMKQLLLDTLTERKLE